MIYGVIFINTILIIFCFYVFLAYKRFENRHKHFDDLWKKLKDAKNKKMDITDL